MAAPRPAAARRPVEQAVAGCEALAVQLRIAAGEVDGVGRSVRGLVGQGREEGEGCDPAATPAIEHGLVGEGEGLVAGDRDVLAKRRQGAVPGRAPTAQGQRPGESLQPVEVDALRHDRRRPVEERLQRAVLHRLHQPQMPARQLEGRVARNAAQDLHPGQRPAQDSARAADCRPG